MFLTYPNQFGAKNMIMRTTRKNSGIPLERIGEKE